MIRRVARDPVVSSNRSAPNGTATAEAGIAATDRRCRVQVRSAAVPRGSRQDHGTGSVAAEALAGDDGGARKIAKEAVSKHRSNEPRVQAELRPRAKKVHPSMSGPTKAADRCRPSSGDVMSPAPASQELNASFTPRRREAAVVTISEAVVGQGVNTAQPAGENRHERDRTGNVAFWSKLASAGQAFGDREGTAEAKFPGLPSAKVGAIRFSGARAMKASRPHRSSIRIHAGIYRSAEGERWLKPKSRHQIPPDHATALLSGKLPHKSNCSRSNSNTAAHFPSVHHARQSGAGAGSHQRFWLSLSTIVGKPSTSPSPWRTGKVFGHAGSSTGSVSAGRRRTGKLYRRECSIGRPGARRRIAPSEISD